MLEAYSSIINLPIENTQEKIDRLGEEFDKLSKKSEMSKSTMVEYGKVLLDNLRNTTNDGSEFYKQLAARTKEALSIINQLDYQYQNSYVQATVDNLREQNSVNRQGAQIASNNYEDSNRELAEAIRNLVSNGISTDKANAREMYDLDKLSGLSSAQIKAISEYNVAIQKNKIAQDGLREATNKLMDSEIETANAVVEAGQKMLDNIQSYYDPRTQLWNSYSSRDEARLERKELTGQEIVRADYAP